MGLVSLGGGKPAHLKVTLCPIPPFFRVSEEQILCVTPPGAGTARVPIHLQIGGAEVPVSWTFHYKEDPVVLDISPKCGYR